MVQSTPGEAEVRTTTLKGSPNTAAGALFQSVFCRLPASAGPSDTAVIERRRFQRPFNRTGRDFSVLQSMRKSEFSRELKGKVALEHE